MRQVLFALPAPIAAALLLSFAPLGPGLARAAGPAHIPPPAHVPTIVRGRVILDANGNGQFDPGESGIAGVPVSDGVNFALTGADGSYELKIADDPVIPYRPSRMVAVSWPSGLWPSSLWYRRFSELPDGQPLDFLLRHDQQKLPFTIVQGTDPHNALEGDVCRLFRDEVAAMGDHVQLCIFTGDLGYASYQGVAAEFTSVRDFTRSFPLPMFHTVGNHDVVGIHTTNIWQEKNDLAGNGAFTKYVGPVRWSFNYAGIHLVAIDWMKIVKGKLDLGVPDVAVDWLEKDLSLLKPQARILLFVHCVSPLDARFFDVAVQHKIELILAGHSHRNLDISYRGIRALTTMNLRGPYRLATVTDHGVQIVNRCLGCKGPSYHSKNCELFRAHQSMHKEGTGTQASWKDVALDSTAREVGSFGPGPEEVLAVIEPGTSRQCGLRLTSPGDEKPLDITFADNVLTAGDVQTAVVRRRDQKTYDVRVYLEDGLAKIFANDRVQADVPFNATGPTTIAAFADAGHATFNHLDIWPAERGK